MGAATPANLNRGGKVGRTLIGVGRVHLANRQNSRINGLREKRSIRLRSLWCEEAPR